MKTSQMFKKNRTILKAVKNQQKSYTKTAETRLSRFDNDLNFKSKEKRWNREETILNRVTKKTFFHVSMRWKIFQHHCASEELPQLEMKLFLTGFIFVI